MKVLKTKGGKVLTTKTGKLLGIKEWKKDEIPEQIQSLAKERDLVRRNKDWARSDKLRDAIKDLGYEVNDTPEGTQGFKL